MKITYIQNSNQDCEPKPHPNPAQPIDAPDYVRYNFTLLQALDYLRATLNEDWENELADIDGGLDPHPDYVTAMDNLAELEVVVANHGEQGVVYMFFPCEYENVLVLTP